MKFQNYQNKKIKNYFKNYSLLLISNGINQKSKNQVLIKQELKKLKIIYYKTYNKLTIKIFKNSIYKNLAKLIYSTIFFLTTKQKYFNITIIKYLETIKFLILGIKLNKIFYSITQLKNIKSTSYISGVSMFYQFVLINLKLIQIYKNNRFETM